MEIMDIYNNAQNPIDNPEVLNKFIEIYSTPYSFYNGLVYANNTVDSRRFSVQDENDFYVMMFNKWRSSIINMTKEEYIELYKKGVYKKDFIKLRKYLIHMPELKTKDEILEELDKKRVDKELEKAFDRYRWTRLGEASGWNHICSRYLHAKKDNYPDVTHRLYLNIDSIGIYKIGKCFMEECEKENIPYYFKYELGDNRDDSVVVYSSTEHLTKYIEILQKIKKEHKELEPYINKPPLLSSPIDGWMGYGSEPVCKQKNGDSYSFNLLRSEILEKSIGKATSEWIRDHQNMVINFQGRKVTFDNYILMMATNRFIDGLEKRYDSRVENRKRGRRILNKPYDENDVIEELGYSKQDLANPKFRENVYKVIMSNKKVLMDAVTTGNYKELESINMTVRNNKKITFSKYDISYTVKALTPKIAKFDPQYTQNIQSIIKQVSPKYGVDPNNFSFDTPRVREMRMYEDYLISKKLEEDKKEKETPQVQISKPRERQTHETDEEYNAYLKTFYGKKKQELSDMFKKTVERPRERQTHETDEEYERYLKEFYGGSSKK